MAAGRSRQGTTRQRGPRRLGLARGSGLHGRPVRRRRALHDRRAAGLDRRPEHSYAVRDRDRALRTGLRHRLRRGCRPVLRTRAGGPPPASGPARSRSWSRPATPPPTSWWPTSTSRGTPRIRPGRTTRPKRSSRRCTTASTRAAGRCGCRLVRTVSPTPWRCTRSARCVETGAIPTRAPEATAPSSSPIFLAVTTDRCCSGSAVVPGCEVSRPTTRGRVRPIPWRTTSPSRSRAERGSVRKTT